MTTAQAITEIRNGNAEGLGPIVSQTAPGIWMAVSLLCGRKIGRVMTEIYQEAWENTAALRSPSDLRPWLCGIAYPMMESHLDASAEIAGDTAAHVFYRMLAALPREERTAVILLCGEGCTASQAEKICGRPEIEIKRALRRARTALAEQARQQGAFAGQTVNTDWIIRHMQEMKTQLAQHEVLYRQVCACAISGQPFEEDKEEAAALETAPTPVSETLRETGSTEDEKSGFFSRLFRPKRF